MAGQPPARAAAAATFSSLRVRNFRLFATGQVISNTGTWMQRVAQDWLVLELTHGSGVAVGLATGLQFLPLLMFSLWGGMIADRYPKRRVLMVTQAAMGGLALILGVLAVTGTVRPWHIYLLAFGLGLATVVDNPTRQSFAIEMVGRDDLQNAIGLNSAVFNLARITGPAVAGLVISLIGTSAAFFVNAASYLTVMFSLHLMRQSELHPAERVARAKGQLREGLAYVRSRPDLLMTMVLVFFVATFGMNFQVTTALMSRVVFDTGAGKFGLASAVFAVGALIGALVAARRSRTGMRMLVWTGAGVRRAGGRDRADAVLLVVPGPAGADRPGPDQLQHAGELLDSAHHARRDAGPGDGNLHARLPRRRSARRTADRLGRRAVRHQDRHAGRRGDLDRRPPRWWPC